MLDMTTPIMASGLEAHPAGILELRRDDGMATERIPLALVREVINGLPEDGSIGTNARKALQQWCASAQERQTSSDEIEHTMMELVEFAHSSSTELGEVGRLPRGPSGRIVEPSQYDSAPMPSAVVLALALQRLVVLLGAEQMGRSLWLVAALEAEGIPA
jgi:hypothetical protein